MYVTGAQGHVFVQIRNIMHRIFMLPNPGPGPDPVQCMFRETYVILKAALHTRLAV